MCLLTNLLYSSLPVSFNKRIFVVVVEAFRQTDADYLNEAKGQQKDAGSTASTAVLLGDRLLVANVGDSRVVACRAGSGWLLSMRLTYILQNRIHRSFEHEIVKIVWEVGETYRLHKYEIHDVAISFQ